MNTTDVRGTLRDMWDTRPARPRDDRHLVLVPGPTPVQRVFELTRMTERLEFIQP